jgi:hypothetical protein
MLEDMWFQPNNRPENFTRYERQFSDQGSEDHWISLATKVANMTPLDDYLQRHMKSLVYTWKYEMAAKQMGQTLIPQCTSENMAPCIAVLLELI